LHRVKIKLMIIGWRKIATNLQWVISMTITFNFCRELRNVIFKKVFSCLDKIQFQELATITIKKCYHFHCHVMKWEFESFPHY
jgi:hypothetical protein